MSLRSVCALSVALAVVLSSAAWADQSGSSTLAANTFLNLETGVASSAGGDILWNGVALSPQGRAGLYNLGKRGSRAFKFITARHASSAPYSPAPIPASALVAGDVFGVRTNSGHYAKVIVTAAHDGSLSLQYKTFMETRSAGTPVRTADPQPVISSVLNNYSYVLPGLPNYGIAPGSLFVIFGSGLSGTAPPVTQSSAPPGLPTSLSQTSVSVTVNGATTTPALYYVSAGLVAAVLPSTTQVGTGTVTVTYNGQASAPAPIQVVPSAVGLDTLDGSGNGLGVATDTNFNLLGLTTSAAPGQTVILWGSGVGADTSSDDRTYPQNSNNLTSIPMQVFIGGISANVVYRGRSQYPGLDQIAVTIPSNVSPGCFVSVVVATGTVVSNNVTLPVNPGGGPCSDPGTGLTGTQLQSVAKKSGGKVNSLAVTVSQENLPQGTINSSAVVIAAGLSSAYFGKGYEYVSQGSCTIVPPAQGNFNNQDIQPLDPGTVQMTGPGGTLNLGAGGGFYQGQLPSSLTSSPGTYTFTASGGANVGSFRTSINVTAPLTWTNRASLATITRSQGATVTWTGGFPNGDVQVNGGVGGKFGTVRFYCHAPSSAGQITIPASILQALPAGPGLLEVTNYSAPQTVTATGVDVGLAFATVIFALQSSYK